MFALAILLYLLVLGLAGTGKDGLYNAGYKSLPPSVTLPLARAKEADGGKEPIPSGGVVDRASRPTPPQTPL